MKFFLRLSMNLIYTKLPVTAVIRKIPHIGVYIICRRHCRRNKQDDKEVDLGDEEDSRMQVQFFSVTTIYYLVSVKLKIHSIQLFFCYRMIQRSVSKCVALSRCSNVEKKKYIYGEAIL